MFTEKKPATGSLLIWVVFYGFYLVRNNVYNKYEFGRRVYAYSHPDIGWFSSIYHGFLIFWFCYLSGLVISNFIDSTQKDSPVAEEGNSKSIENFLLISRETTLLYEKWIFNSLVLGLGFIGFLSTYKDLVLVHKDFRYYPSIAISIILWCVCWFCISRPLINKLLFVEKIKGKILHDAIKEPSTYSIYENLIKDNTFLGKQSLFISLGLSLAAIIGSILNIIK